MFYVYILQAIGKPGGNVKIGFSARTSDRISALEPGALGERLHAILQVDAGETYSDGRRIEKAYHNKFALNRINREWFRLDLEMLTWVPDGFTAIYPKIGSPASNTVPYRRLEAGDLMIFQQVIIQEPTKQILSRKTDFPIEISQQTTIQRPNEQKLLDPGDLTAAITVQKVVQRG